jgi:hypothetical protein
MSLIHQMRGGRDYDSTFGVRQRGTGLFADLIARRFSVACRRLDFNREQPPLDASCFRPPEDSPVRTFLTRGAERDGNSTLRGPAA